LACSFAAAGPSGEDQLPDLPLLLLLGHDVFEVGVELHFGTENVAVTFGGKF
jgi:hypothetical protein